MLSRKLQKWLFPSYREIEYRGSIDNSACLYTYTALFAFATYTNGLISIAFPNNCNTII